MTLKLLTKADRYRRPAELFGWRDCSYLMCQRSKVANWMSYRTECLRVQTNLMMLAGFARTGIPAPPPECISLSLVVNSVEGGCRVYHVIAPPEALESLANGRVGGLSSRDIILEPRPFTAAGDAVPLIASGIESSTVPEHPDAIGSGT